MYVTRIHKKKKKIKALAAVAEKIAVGAKATKTKMCFNKFQSMNWPEFLLLPPTRLPP